MLTRRSFGVDAIGMAQRATPQSGRRRHHRSGPKRRAPDGERSSLRLLACGAAAAAASYLPSLSRSCSRGVFMTYLTVRACGSYCFLIPFGAGGAFFTICSRTGSFGSRFTPYLLATGGPTIAAPSRFPAVDRGSISTVESTPKDSPRTSSLPSSSVVSSTPAREDRAARGARHLQKMPAIGIRDEY
jgi:hypothetical protein